MNLCNQRHPEGIRMHEIRFTPGQPPPHTSPPRRFRRLDHGAFGASASTPSASRSRRFRHLLLCRPPTYYSFPRACISERLCGGESLRRGAISSVCTFTFTCMARCGLFVLKVPLKPNQPTVASTEAAPVFCVTRD